MTDVPNISPIAVVLAHTCGLFGRIKTAPHA
jgi:hypothetical protein